MRVIEPIAGIIFIHYKSLGYLDYYFGEIEHFGKIVRFSKFAILLKLASR